MKILAPILLSLVLLMPLAAAPKPAPDLPSLMNRVERSLVQVVFQADEQRQHSCTGFIVDAAKGLVLTAEHCVEKDENYVNGLLSDVIKKDSHLALLKVPSMMGPPLDIRKDKLERGEQVIAMGWGYGILGGSLRMVYNSNYDGELILDGALSPGMSGGPIVDMEGKVVGVSQAAFQGIAAGCNQDSIRKFLK